MNSSRHDTITAWIDLQDRVRKHEKSFRAACQQGQYERVVELADRLARDYELMASYGRKLEGGRRSTAHGGPETLPLTRDGLKVTGRMPIYLEVHRPPVAEAGGRIAEAEVLCEPGPGSVPQRRRITSQC
jgi:hypothetical protein